MTMTVGQVCFELMWVREMKEGESFTFYLSGNVKDQDILCLLLMLVDGRRKNFKAKWDGMSGVLEIFCF